ncbi:hypothetical protein F5I97DRAFT_120093 [Phlebopus sp. FC_14]|nr:hypothetical protein F5I97DRAFT_120093 [Phlebopus sp. FC_14]
MLFQQQQDQRFINVEARLDNTEARLDNMEAMLDNVEARLVDVTEISYQAFNRGCGDGTRVRYKIIPFRMPDGALALPQQFGLPLLVDVDIIEDLTDEQLNSYLDHYHVGRAGNLLRQTKIARLKGFVGCARRRDVPA